VLAPCEDETELRAHLQLGPAIPGVVIWVGLERRTADTGALRLVPGSHIPQYEGQLWAYGGAEPDASGFEQPDWPD
jgi:ectoine hydroxylase-related dioxygenase (phytanoyl-CoA dioxygenase family)